MIDLSILIVNWNTRDYLAKCLRSLSDTATHVAAAAHTLAFGNYAVDVFVVDNASTDDSVAMVRTEFAWVKLIENDRNAGFACANNQGIRASEGHYVLLLNSDTEVKPDAIVTLIDFMDATPHAGAAGAHLLNADGSLQPSCQPMLTPWREFWRLTFLDNVWRRSTYNMTRWTSPTPHRVEVIKGACLMLRRAALDGIGLLDEQYFMYTEEVDLCYRLMKDGWTLHWLPRAVVVHYGEASSQQIAETMYVQLYRSKVQFYRKTGGEARAQLFKRLVTVAYIPRLIVTSIAQRLHPKLAAQVRTFRHLLVDLPTM